MGKLKCVLMFGLVLLLTVGCSKEEIQPEPLNAADDISQKSAKVNQKNCKGDHYVPFKARFELTADFIRYGPIEQWDFQEDWIPTVKVGGMYLDIEGSGIASHLGRTEFTIQQWWSKMYGYPGVLPPDSYGHGKITFTAANGDLLYATYWGTADHQFDDDGTEIVSHGEFTGGTGRFENAKGEFLWEGLFFREVPVPAPPPAPQPDPFEMGYGTVTVSGTIKYNK